ncbi:peptidoglycan DD-metalloendopeptidase family protein [Oligoflexia bacterium]|nr:peptidoglycan DD-metalloendopeptidase family protein [Oligoflexia bacterium]
MYYPLNLLKNDADVFPLLGNQLQGAPHIFNFTSKNPRTLDYDTTDFDDFQSKIFDELKESGKSWGIGKYLEERSNVLRQYPQMIEEGRIYHVGLDIVVPGGYQLYAPIDAVVHEAGLDGGVGNYGGYVILRHEFDSVTFFSIYGHLNSAHQVQAGVQLAKGQVFAEIGVREDSGLWFTHTHLQILTEHAVNEGKMLQGYISSADLAHVELLFPTPYPMFRY